MSSLNDAETMRDERMGKTRTQNQWLVGPAGETLGASCPRCCARIYIVMPTYSLDYLPGCKEKGMTQKMERHRSLSVASDVWGKSVERVG